MTWLQWLYVWLAFGFLTCVWSIRDDLKNGKDFTIGDIPLVIITTPFGPVFTMFCMHLCWERSKMASRVLKWLKQPLIKGEM